jgi:NTP pyrophosphatase (non-canonical NTP hydrolase)
MKLRDLLQFIEVQDENLKRYYSGLGQESLILARTVKLTEELGELCQEVLVHCFLQRKQKLEKFDKQKLPEEFADILITALLLAKSMDVDVEAALEKKIRKIERRIDGVDVR